MGSRVAKCVTSLTRKVIAASQCRRTSWWCSGRRSTSIRHIDCGRSEAPDFVLEIASESTYRVDRGEKRDTCADMGVLEYWQYDPVGTYLNPPLLGFRLVEGRYVPIPAVVQEDGMLTLRSETLGLELHLRPGAPVREAPHFYDPVRGEYLRTYREAEARLEQTEGQLRQMQGRLWEEQAARQCWKLSFGSCGSAGVRGHPWRGEYRAGQGKSRKGRTRREERDRMVAESPTVHDSSAGALTDRKDITRGALWQMRV